MLIAEAIGLGLVASLLFTEVMGLAAGGFVVPGYVALYLDRPLQVAGTILAALTTWAVVRLAGRFLLIYGRRSLVFAVLVGFVVGMLVTRVPALRFATLEGQLTVIGFIIPGLIAYWMSRQGILQTLASLTVASILVRLSLIILHGGGLLESPRF